MIVVNTVGHRSGANDYWEEIEYDTYHNEYFDEQDERYIFDGSLDECLDAANIDSFIVKEDVPYYSDADYTVSAYDGYNE